MGQVYNPKTLFEYIDMSTVAGTPDYALGRIYWDALDNTLAVMLSNSTDSVTMQVGQEVYIYARNNTGSDIANGAAVTCSGATGERPTIALAQADSITTSRVTGITTQAMAKNTSGFVTLVGLVRGFDTQTPGWNEGDRLYLSEAAAGGLRNTVPASGFLVPVARVLRKHPTDGILMVNPWQSPVFGDVVGGNYTAWSYDGTGQAFGNATCYRDLLQSVTGAQLTSPAGDFQQNTAEASVTAKTSARYPADYITTNWQINHDWAVGTTLYPHIHWWQTTANTPNWLLAYRWQDQGTAKTTAWSLIPWSENIFTWTTGTLNQITKFGSITPPVGAGPVSDIVQVRLYRDYTNVSTLFAGGDPVAADQDIVNLDVHYIVDMIGSRTEYVK